jgi:4-deoxy-L-threo-5-hexosulose-uronate ketol-isomerase
VSYPAHTAYPTRLITPKDAEQVQLGSQQEANQRTIHKFIHLKGIKSCQLVMGFTRLQDGCVWNTMPPHTHSRRSEVYLYFDLAPDAAVFHFMGTAEQSRHLVVRSGEAVISPPWSMHCGAGTRNYSFVWAMGGENQDYTDMDAVAVKDWK